MTFHMTQEYNIRFNYIDEATPGKDLEDGFQTTADARSSPFQDELFLWRNPMLADTSYDTADRPFYGISATLYKEPTQNYLQSRTCPPFRRETNQCPR